ncbi:hypothetical protein Y032_0031g2344 [Ancylostoma ceylanicum]|uniref:7TM GPCR serpentine receptor class x (Srx) domain-containing protein n=1 Tax=Ancylostoma ceylanicum TaxID=53326 RepID=A0A016UPW5_9BILA|nr:hypothetical protein Y032_0031g2344 [Ancylostoma ceylanicum]
MDIALLCAYRDVILDFFVLIIVVHCFVAVMDIALLCVYRDVIPIFFVLCSLLSIVLLQWSPLLSSVVLIH